MLKDSVTFNQIACEESIGFFTLSSYHKPY